jgi:hypothetical protein
MVSYNAFSRDGPATPHPSPVGCSVRVFQLPSLIPNHHRGCRSGQLDLHRGPIGKVQVKCVILLPYFPDLAVRDCMRKLLIGSHRQLISCTAPPELLQAFVPLVSRYPIGGDCPLHGRQIKLPGANQFMQSVFEPVLHVRVPGDVVGLRPKIAQAVRAPEFERDQMIDLPRRARV